MVLLYYQDSVCWCVFMMGHSYKDEVERQVQDELSQKTTENDECLPEVDTPNGSGIEEVKAFLLRNGSNSNGFRFPRSWWQLFSRSVYLEQRIISQALINQKKIQQI